MSRHSAPVLDALAALQGIATYAGAARQEFTARDADPDVLDVLRVLEAHARVALNASEGKARGGAPASIVPLAGARPRAPHPDRAEPPQTLEGRYVPGASAPVIARPVSAEECVKWLLGDTPPMVERLPLLSLVARVPEIGPDDARRLVHRRRINGHAQLRTIALQPLMALARDILEIAEATA